MNDKADIAIPLLIASEHLLRVARDVESRADRDSESNQVYHIIDAIDREVLMTYGINVDELVPVGVDAALGIIFNYRNEELTISECLNQLEKFAAQACRG
ncbi:hypothetical protein SAMN04488542_10559 [Fontibacillus panacisegetis]|uniref:Uncharacterized protein n=1 Tax=Fontibacillus panacisegetis TaxID=670482 RepID=A0A1G7HX63_9BACL|nr:hypothetical protein [Fontibacillus panacisegetis]SDF04689.1 hypothetical protein SAMN04488542_10559 [Fontibacillus panacisegetis]